MLNSATDHEAALPTAKSDLTDEQATFLCRFDLSKGSDELLQVETLADDATARELLNLGLIAYINAVYIFAQLTPAGVALVKELREEN
jgi:hypothetical protein